MKLWDGSWDTCTCGEGGDDGLAWASRVNRNVSDYGDDGDCVNEEMRSNSSSNPQMSNQHRLLMKINFCMNISILIHPLHCWGATT